MPEAFFLQRDVPGGAAFGQRYAVYHPAQGKTRGAVLYVHPFGEELNKSRRMAALAARAMSGAGYAVLQVDLLGCGDSSGDFGDASWVAWIDDLVAAAAWLASRVDAPLCLCGLRAGCLLAVQAAAHIVTDRLLLWQPMTSGKQALQQFLRLKLAGDMVGGGPKTSMESLHARLAAGEAIDIAGYVLAPALAQGLQGALLAPPPGRPTPEAGRLVCIEVSPRVDPGLSAAATGALAQWQRAGWAATGQVVTGPAFWQSVEMEEAIDLPPAMLQALQTLYAA